MPWGFSKTNATTGKVFDDSSSTSSLPLEKRSRPIPLPTIAGKDPGFGQGAVIKTFYEGKGSCGSDYDWVDTPPKQLSKKTAKAHDRVAIKVYKIIDKDQPKIAGRAPLKFHMLEIQSPVLIAALKDIVEEEDVYLDTSEIAKFEAPFRPLYFCYDRIMGAARSAPGGSILAQHMTLLVGLMKEMFGDLQIRLKHLRASNLMAYDLAWTYFPKNSLVYEAAINCKRLCKVYDTQYTYKKEHGPHMVVIAHEIDFDGRKFSWRKIKIRLSKFEGNRPINSLYCYPFSFHDDQEGVKARLTARGKKALDFQQVTCCEYEGLAFSAGSDLETKHHVSGRVLIDIYGYEKHHRGPERRDEWDDCDSTSASKKKKSSASSKYLKEISDERQKRNKEEMLARPHDLMLISPFLEGYSLKAKLWLHFFVDDLQPVAWNDEAYDHLVYPTEQKDLVLTFVENHKRTKTTVDDVIMGKGQGLVFLLSGPPGTGKTLTAEAVADKTRRPLYHVQAEELGINAEELGARIKKVFEMATEWNAVVLLDEADVFMAERAPTDLDRNELVSIFLRELEYFRGIIFLTTNLYRTIDAAFRSRVNIHLLFDPLAPPARRVLWRKFLERLPPSAPGGGAVAGFSEGDFEELARWELNGREIKNAIKTVKTWCDCKGYEISLLRLESGIKVTAPQAQKT